MGSEMCIRDRITIVIVGRSMIGNHFKKKFSKRPPPGIIVTEVIEKEFSEQIETYGTAISKKSKTFKIKKDDLFEDLKLKNFVKKGDVLILSLIHISEPTRPLYISYAVFCLKQNLFHLKKFYL